MTSTRAPFAFHTGAPLSPTRTGIVCSTTPSIGCRRPSDRYPSTVLPESTTPVSIFSSPSRITTVEIRSQGVTVAKDISGASVTP